MSIDKPPAPDFEDLFDGAPCGLVVTDEDGTILRSNRIFSLWMGISQEALTQRRFQDLLTMGGKIFHQSHWAPLMRMQGSVAEVKLDLKNASEQTVCHAAQWREARACRWRLLRTGAVRDD